MEIDNPEEGLIAGRITLPFDIRIPGVLPSKCNFSFVIISKDGRLKAQFYNFQLTQIYALMRSIQHEMELVYTLMDFKKVHR